MNPRRTGNVNQTSTIVFTSMIGICVVAVLLVAVPPVGVLVALGWAGTTVVQHHVRKSKERAALAAHRAYWGY